MALGHVLVTGEPSLFHQVVECKYVKPLLCLVRYIMCAYALLHLCTILSAVLNCKCISIAIGQNSLSCGTAIMHHVVVIHAVPWQAAVSWQAAGLLSAYCLLLTLQALPVCSILAGSSLLSLHRRQNNSISLWP